MNICICSAFRNSSKWVSVYLDKLFGLQYELRNSSFIYPVWVVGDSTDGTQESLYYAANIHGARLIEYNHGGPVHPSIEDPDRFRQLAGVAGAMWEAIPGDADAVILLDGDLVWDKGTLIYLLDQLDTFPAIAPMVMHLSNPGLYDGEGPFFYDTWAFVRNGVNFTNRKPYHPDIEDKPDTGETRQVSTFQRPLQLDSAGGCLVMRAGLARGYTWEPSLLVRGLCRHIYELGGSVWLDPTREVFHP